MICCFWMRNRNGSSKRKPLNSMPSPTRIQISVNPFNLVTLHLGKQKLLMFFFRSSNKSSLTNSSILNRKFIQKYHNLTACKLMIDRKLILRFSRVKVTNLKKTLSKILLITSNLPGKKLRTNIKEPLFLRERLRN